MEMFFLSGEKRLRRITHEEKVVKWFSCYASKPYQQKRQEGGLQAERLSESDRAER
ncbi:hypothetical protein J2X83_001519 [Brevibacillus nitrificans]|nr:hypothetical protein [Brevibacillus nitrificans]